MGMKDAFLFGEGKKRNAFGSSPLDRRYENALYWNSCSRVSKPSERGLCVPFSCGLLSQLSTHTACRDHPNPLQADHEPGLPGASGRAEERETMPDPVHLAGPCGPPVCDPSADETHHRSFLSMLATGVATTHANIAHLCGRISLLEFLLCQHTRWCFLERHQAVP